MTSTRRRPTMPTTVRPRRTLRAGASAFGALMVLAGLLGGPPLLLLHFVHNPLLGFAHFSLMKPLTDLAIKDILAIVIWLAWAQLTCCVLMETVTGIRGLRRPSGLPRASAPARVPLTLGFQQKLARQLVVALLAFLSIAPSLASFTNSSNPAKPVAVATAGLSPIAFHAPHDDIPTTAVTPLTADWVVVKPGDDLDQLARTHLGSPSRWVDIWELNQDSAQPGGTHFTDPSMIRPGWTLRLPTTQLEPADSFVDVTVQPHDTMWSLAQTHLGTGEHWPQIWRANQGSLQPGGQRFTDPTKIRPGWVLRIPAEATEVPPAIRTLAAAPQVGALPSTSSPSPMAATTISPSAQASPLPPTDPAPAPNLVPTQTAAPSAASTSLPRPASQTASRSAHRAGPTDRSDIVALVGGATLLSGLLFGALTRHRRRQFRYRRPGRSVAATPLRLVHTEQALAADAAHATPNVTWLNQALRGLTQELSSIGQAPPEVIAVGIGGDELELVLATPDEKAPPPWNVDDTHTRWVLNRGAGPGFDSSRRAFHFAPYPALVSVGYTSDGQHWMLDLEQAGAITLSGDIHRGMDLIRFVAAELAHNVWSENLHVTLVGFDAGLATLNPERLTCTDNLDDAVRSLHTALDTGRQIRDQATMGVLESRQRAGIVGDGWPPQLLFIAGATDSEISVVSDLYNALSTDRSRNPAALLVVQDAERPERDGLTLNINERGTLRIPALGLSLTAHQLPPQEAANLAELLTLAANTDDLPMPAADSDQPWDAYSDMAGAPRVNFTSPTASQGPPIGPHHSTAAQSPGIADLVDAVLPLADDVYSQIGASTPADIASAPPISATVRQQIQDADPTLDADVATWQDPASPLPKLAVLGPITLYAHGTPPPKRLAYYTEVIAYLASRPRGATAEDLGSALHPNDPDIREKTTSRNAASIARKWLGANPRTGREHLQSAAAGRALGVYELQDVLWDAELFRRLRLRGIARGPDGIDDLWQALNLVTGAPFGRQRPDGYSWLMDATTGIRLDFVYLAMIVDVAHTLATHSLRDGHPELAITAAQCALKAGASDDIALLDLVAACDALDRRAEADQYVAAIMANHDSEDPEDLPPRTYDVLRRRKYPDARPTTTHSSAALPTVRRAEQKAANSVARREPT